MDNKFTMPDLAKRERNFFNGKEPTTPKERFYYEKLQELTINIEAEIQNFQDENPVDILKSLVFPIYMTL